LDPEDGGGQFLRKAPRLLCHKLELITLRVSKILQPIYKTVTLTTR